MADDTILKALEGIHTKLDKQQKVLATLQDSQAHIKTTLETFEAGQNDIREQLTTKADKSDIHNLGVRLDKYQRQNKTRLDNLEEKTGSHNPTKN